MNVPRVSYLPLSPSIFPPPRHSSCNSVLLIRQERNRLLCPTQLRKPGTHLYALILPCRRNGRPRKSPLALSWGKMTCIISNYLFYPLQCVQTFCCCCGSVFCFCLLQCCVGTFILKTWTSTRNSIHIEESFFQELPN